MKVDNIKKGNLVRVDALRSSQGILAAAEHIQARRAGGMGKVISWYQPYQDENVLVVWVQHGKESAPYWDYELVLQGVRD